MNARTSGIVLWCVLALLLPLPFFVEQWGWWPLLRAAMAAWQGVATLWWQVALWGLLLAGLAIIYSRAAPRMPPKWPGALVGLLCWGLAFLLATVPVARPPFAAQEPVLLRALYALEN